MNSIQKLGRPVVEKKVIQMYVMEKLGAPTIAKEFGISKTEVYRILESNNIERRQRKALVAQQIMKLYEQMSIPELSEHFGLQEKTIRIIISQNEEKNYCE
ncbi:hypothetical protein QPM05_15405 [Caldibacillus thermoamylovorans]|jgi:DNA-binding transcriptional regulator LsrR (DeoR family)|nr:hypothetical protein [Caldibacillus thermoamylovorans]